MINRKRKLLALPRDNEFLNITGEFLPFATFDVHSVSPSGTTAIIGYFGESVKAPLTIGFIDLMFGTMRVSAAKTEWYQKYILISNYKAIVYCSYAVRLYEFKKEKASPVCLKSLKLPVEFAHTGEFDVPFQHSAPLHDGTQVALAASEPLADGCSFHIALIQMPEFTATYKVVTPSKDLFDGIEFKRLNLHNILVGDDCVILCLMSAVYKAVVINKHTWKCDRVVYLAQSSVGRTLPILVEDQLILGVEPTEPDEDGVAQVDGLMWTSANMRTGEIKCFPTCIRYDPSSAYSIWPHRGFMQFRNEQLAGKTSFEMRRIPLKGCQSLSYLAHIAALRSGQKFELPLNEPMKPLFGPNPYKHGDQPRGCPYSLRKRNKQSV